MRLTGENAKMVVNRPRELARAPPLDAVMSIDLCRRNLTTPSMPTGSTLRVARRTDHLAAITAMYMQGLGLSVLAEFLDHDGFDGTILKDIERLGAVIAPTLGAGGRR